MAETGFLIIADISGYTAFLTQTELDHAEDILNTLINKLVDSMSTMFIIAKLEGDAVFAYAPKGSFKQAQTLVECVENIYCAFAQTQRDMKLNTTCTCEACRLIPSLDLKIVLHHGQYMFSNIGGREELSGPDVILVHRLLKSTITEKAGVEAYVFFSEACEEVVDLSSLSLSMQRHEEEYEHLGVVGGCIYNLQPVWEVRQKQEVYRITDEDCLFKAEMRIPAPLALAWEYLTDTGTYMQRQPGITGWAVKKKKGGRVAPGTEQHCAHGANNEVLVITIIDWQPLKYYTCAFALPLGSTMYATYKVSEIDDENTLVTTYFQIKGKRPWQTPIVSALLYFPMKKNFVGGVDALEVIFADLVSEDVEAGRIMPLPVSRPEAVG